MQFLPQKLRVHGRTLGDQVGIIEIKVVVLVSQVDVHLADFILGAFEREFYDPDDVAGICEAELAELNENSRGLRIVARFDFQRSQARPVRIGHDQASDVMTGGGYYRTVQTLVRGVLCRS